jgi:hypothetical protein
VLGAALPEAEVGRTHRQGIRARRRRRWRRWLETIRKLPYELLRVLQADGMPLVLPARAYGRSGDALRLDVISRLIPDPDGQPVGRLSHPRLPPEAGRHHQRDAHWLARGR